MRLDVRNSYLSQAYAFVLYYRSNEIKINCYKSNEKTHVNISVNVAIS